MKIAINTDFMKDTASPEPYLRLISEAGIPNIMWCHHWNSDFLYGKHEIAQIKTWLKDYNIVLQDLHATRGVEKCWFSVDEYSRRAGVELVVNRLLMLKELDGCGTLVMHPPRIPVGAAAEDVVLLKQQAESVRRSIEELMPLLEKYDVQLALENLPYGNWEILSSLLEEFPAERVGLCLDSGHCNLIKRPHYAEFEKYAHRVISVHLHDNDGTSDQHQPPFTATFDWEWLAKLMKKTPYTNPLNFELSMSKSPFYVAGAADHTEALRGFLQYSKTRCQRFAAMCEK